MLSRSISVRGLKQSGNTAKEQNGKARYMSSRMSEG